MADEPNPYQTPTATERPSRGWWIRLRAWWHRGQQLARSGPRFDRGEAILFEGIAFFLDPDDADTLHAATPSSVATEPRMRLVVNEVAYTLHVFLAENPHTHPWLRGRRLVVRLVESYEDLRTEIYPPVDLGTAPVERALESRPATGDIPETPPPDPLSLRHRRGTVR